MRFNSIFILLLLSGCCAMPQESEKVFNDDMSLSQRLLSRQQCRSMGGEEVGDIGDGRIHRPDYRCQNKQPPLGTIIAEQGQPIATEGSVCCGVVEE